MRSSSFLGTLGRVRGVVGDCRSARASGDDEAAWAAVGEAHGAVCDLVELCTAGLPLPPLDHSPPADADDVVAGVLDDRYRELGGGALRTDGGTDGPPERTEAEAAGRYAAERRVETVDGHRVVPLARTGPAAANWYVLCDVLPGYAAEVATGCRTLAERQRLGGDGSDVGDEWAAIADLLGALVDVLDHHTTIARWAYVPDRETIVAAEDAAAFADQMTEETRNFR